MEVKNQARPVPVCFIKDTEELVGRVMTGIELQQGNTDDSIRLKNFVKQTIWEWWNALQPYSDLEEVKDYVSVFGKTESDIVEDNEIK